MKSIQHHLIDETKMCSGCPFNYFSDESEKIQNYGCLPDSNQITNMYKNNEGHWKCHSAKRKCGGLSEVLKQLDLPKMNDKLLVTEENK